MADEVLYVRNARPNIIVFKYNNVRYKLQHRGNREDSVAIPAEAEKDAVISRWLKNGQLEKISRDSFMKLGRRTVDILPNEFLKKTLRNTKEADLKLMPSPDDASGVKVDIVAADAVKVAGTISRPEWAGELMTTEEELEAYNYGSEDPNINYPSKNR